jgi:hypothetical protein
VIPMQNKSRLELAARAFFARRAAYTTSKMQLLLRGSCVGSNRSNAAMYWTKQGALQRRALAL